MERSVILTVRGTALRLSATHTAGRFPPTSLHDWSDGVASSHPRSGVESDNSSRIGTPNGLEQVTRAQAPTVVLRPRQPED